MLCYIIYPTDLSEDDLDSPVCLSRLKVQVKVNYLSPNHKLPW